MRFVLFCTLSHPKIVDCGSYIAIQSVCPVATLIKPGCICFSQFAFCFEIAAHKYVC